MTDEQKQSDAESPLGFSQLKMSAFLILFIGISALAIFTLYRHFQGTVAIPISAFANLPLLGSLFGLLLVYFASDGLRLFFVLRALNCQVPLRDIAPLVFINLFVSNITPMATGGGLAQVWYLQRHKVPVGVATAATTLRTLLAVVFIFVPTPILLLLFSGFSHSPLLDRFSVHLAAFAGLYLLFFYIVLFKTRWLAGVLRHLINVLRHLHIADSQHVRVWRYRVFREILRFSSAFRAFFTGNGLDVAASVFFTFIFLLSLFSFPALILWGIGHPIDYWTSVAFLIVTTFIMYFSPTPGAAGIAEAAFVVSFQQVVAPSHLLTAMIAWRFFTIYLGVLIGIPVTWKAVFKRA